MTEPHDARSALNLRLVLAVFGAVVSAVGAVVLFVADSTAGAVALAAVVVVALVDATVVQARRRARRRREQRDGGSPENHSLFE